jgi:ubiquinone/menaquinone biosynthesis C-methylase UbiE
MAPVHAAIIHCDDDANRALRRRGMEVRMSQITRGQVTASAAEVYEEFYLPALFQEWTGPMLDAAHVEPGARVLDVACGTGVLARALAERVGPRGSVVGLDVNEGMLTVARRVSPRVDWRAGAAERLPFDTESFDAVLSQFGLMFFDDRRAAIREMQRVLKPDGRLVVAVWDTLENTPGYAALVALLGRLFGEAVAGSLRAPFVLGEPRALAALFAEAGVASARVTTRRGTARFPSIGAWVYADVKGWTAADLIDDAGHERLRREAEHELRPFAGDDGAVSFAMPAHIVTATKPR